MAQPLRDNRYDEQIETLHLTLDVAKALNNHLRRIYNGRVGLRVVQGKFHALHYTDKDALHPHPTPMNGLDTEEQEQIETLLYGMHHGEVTIEVEDGVRTIYPSHSYLIETPKRRSSKRSV